MNYHITTSATKQSKVGGMHRTTHSNKTCPPACPFKGNGCYAENYPMSHHWNKVNKGERGDAFKQFVAKLEGLPEGDKIRLAQAGDLLGKGNCISKDAVRLAKAVSHMRAFTYTHKPLTKKNLRLIKEASEHMTINLSANSPAHADKISCHGLPVATAVNADQLENFKTPGGIQIVICPAVKSHNVTCDKCMLCEKKQRQFIIGFPAHGTKKKACQRGADTFKV